MNTTPTSISGIRRCRSNENTNGFRYNMTARRARRGRDNGHIQLEAFEELTQCPYGYDSNDSDAFWNKMPSTRRCAAESIEDCTLEKQERGFEDEGEKKCEKCLGASLELDA